MGLELTINKDLATISVTLTEAVAVTGIIRKHIQQAEFLTLYEEIVDAIHACYSVIASNLTPFTMVNSEAEFIQKFDELNEIFQAQYLKEASKPRLYTEQIYERMQILRTLKEFKTGYPLLKRCFTRFDEYFDKWIDNDTWLVMNMDSVFKMLNRLLQEIADYKRKDPEDAYVVFASAFADFSIYLAIVSQKLALLKQ